MKALKYQLLDEKLNVLEEFKTRKELLQHTDSLPNFGRGLVIYNTIVHKGWFLV